MLDQIQPISVCGRLALQRLACERFDKRKINDRSGAVRKMRGVKHKMSEQNSLPSPACPMAETCKGIIEKPSSGFALIIPGIVFVTLGVLIIVEPLILTWVMAIAFIFLGVMLFLMSVFMRKMGKRRHHMNELT